MDCTGGSLEDYGVVNELTWLRSIAVRLLPVDAIFIELIIRVMIRHLEALATWLYDTPGTGVTSGVIHVS